MEGARRCECAGVCCVCFTSPRFTINARRERSCTPQLPSSLTPLVPHSCRHYDNCVRYGGGKYDVAYGRDEAMLGGLALGAKGSIGNAFNFAAGVYQRMRKAFFAGDMETARFEQGRANAVVNIMNDARFGGAGLVVSRAIYELKGKVKLGPVRAPHLPMTADQQAALRAELDAIKFFEWCD